MKSWEIVKPAGPEMNNPLKKECPVWNAKG